MSNSLSWRERIPKKWSKFASKHPELSHDWLGDSYVELGPNPADLSMLDRFFQVIGEGTPTYLQLRLPHGMWGVECKLIYHTCYAEAELLKLAKWLSVVRILKKISISNIDIRNTLMLVRKSKIHTATFSGSLNGLVDLLRNRSLTVQSGAPAVSVPSPPSTHPTVPAYPTPSNQFLLVDVCNQFLVKQPQELIDLLWSVVMRRDGVLDYESSSFVPAGKTTIMWSITCKTKGRAFTACSVMMDEARYLSAGGMLRLLGVTGKMVEELRKRQLVQEMVEGLRKVQLVQDTPETQTVKIEANAEVIPFTLVKADPFPVVKAEPFPAIKEEPSGLKTTLKRKRPTDWDEVTHSVNSQADVTFETTDASYPVQAPGSNSEDRGSSGDTLPQCPLNPECPCYMYG